jgi:endonuclease YncB( thermonuclease family)
VTLRTLAAVALVAAACSGSVESVTDGTPSVDVASVTDGDTLELADGTVVRLDGINAPERDECLSKEATTALARLVRDGVELVPTGEDQYGRVLAELVADGRSVNEDLVSAGMAISTASGPDPERMRTAEADARRAERGIWDPEACGSGPLPSIEIAMLDADPPGPDGEPGSEERVVIAHAGGPAVDLSGWVLRDESSVHRFVFPEGTVLAGESPIVVTTGCPPAAQGEVPWCTDPVWNNDGDTAFLTEPGGRIVAWLRFAP